jgi:hypothetical protein
VTSGTINRTLGAGICAGALVLATLPWLAPDAALRAAGAQTLDLGGAGSGPTLSDPNGAVDLASSLEKEAEELARNAAAMTGEAKARALAVARVRTIAAYLLRGGATKPWSESAPVAAGARLALLVGRVDALADRAIAGRNAIGDPLPTVDAQRALALLGAVAQCQSEPLRRAMIASQERQPAEIAAALGMMLAPLVDLARLLEARSDLDPWPILADGRASGFDRPTPGAGDLRRAIAALAASPIRDVLLRVLDGWSGRGTLAARELRMLGAVQGAIEWSEAIEAEGPAAVIPQPAIDAMRARLERHLGTLIGDPQDESAWVALESLDVSMAAAKAMLAMRGEPWLTAADRAALADACVALLASDAADSDVERARARTATRISEACVSAARLERSLAQHAPRDLKESLRKLDRDARFAVRALPAAFAALATSPAAASETGDLAALARIRALEVQRERIVFLQQVIDSIAAIRPGAGRGFAAVALRMARMLEDPLKQSDAERAFAAVEARSASAFPFPYEDDLKRRTPRAVTLSGGSPEEVIARAAEWRTAWCEAMGRGDLGGEAAKRLDCASRLCAAMRDLDQVVQPIDRATADRLAMWAPWPMRRSMVAPATQDLDARAALAARSFVNARDQESFARFERDLLALENAIPLVRLTAALERKLAPALRGDPDSVLAQLVPLLEAPSTHAYLATQWSSLLALQRAMLESEYARRTANAKYRDAIGAYMAETARGIEQAAFGGPRPVVLVPGFDGSATPDANREDAGRPGARRRDR